MPPGPGLPWTEILRSNERARWLRAAALACVLAAAALASAWPRAATPPLAAAIAVLVGGALIAWRRAAAAPPALQLRIDADGAIWLRPPPSTFPQAAVLPARPLHVSGRLVTLTAPGGSLALWPDSLPEHGFRRLAAHARWHIDRTAGGAPPAARA